MKRSFTYQRLLHCFLIIGIVLSMGHSVTAAEKKKDSLTVKTGSSPTKNFYEWVNHEWLSATDIPADKPGVNNFLTIRDQVNKEIAGLLVSLSKKQNPTDSDVKIDRIYHSYLDMDGRTSKGISPLLPVLRNIDSAKTYDDIAVLFASMQKIGVGAPIAVEPSSDFKNSDSIIVFISQYGLGLERESYLQDDERSKQTRQYYLEVMSDLFTLASAADPAGKAADVLQLEKELAAIQWSKSDNRDLSKVYNVSDYAGVKKTLGNLAVGQLFERARYPGQLSVQSDAAELPCFVQSVVRHQERVAVENLCERTTADVLC
jgi:putative endopeptidase